MAVNNLIDRDDKILKAVYQVYEDADLESHRLPDGIVRLYDFISEDYPLEVKTIRNMNYKSAAQYIASTIGHTVSLEKNDETPLAGFLYIHNFNRNHKGYILVNENDRLERRRFSIAHELGHYIRHFLPLLEKLSQDDDTKELVISEGLIYSNDEGEQDSPQGDLTFTRGASLYPISNDLAQMEAEANQFAAELLMPREACQKFVEQFIPRFGKRRGVLARRISTEFLVSRSAMGWRLKGLNLP